MLRRALALSAAVAALATVAACTSDGGTTAASAPAATVTATQTVSSAAPPTGSGVPASSTAPASGGATSSGPGLCTPTVMTFAVGQQSGAAGTQYFPVIATNASQSSCVTTGFPGVALLDQDGHQYAQATRDSSQPVQTLTVAPGEKIVAELGVTDVPQGSVGQCPTSSGFLFTLPDNTDSTRIARSAASCTVSVQAFTRYHGA